jgi:hypothetical protein
VLKELLESILSKTQAATAVQRIDMPGQPIDRPYVRVGEKLEKITLDPMPRRIIANSTESIAALAGKDFDFAPLAVGRRAIFVDHESVELIFDTTDGRDRATFRLAPSAEVLFLGDLTRRGGEITQEDLIDAFNFQLRDTLAEPDRLRLIGQINSLKWITNGAVTSAVGQGQNTLGVSVNKQVEMPSVPPTEVQVLSVKAWSTDDFHSSTQLKLHLSTDVNKRVFVFRAFPNSMNEFHDNALIILHSYVSDLVADLKIPVYRASFRQAKSKDQTAE